MPMKRYKPQQIVVLLRQFEVEMTNGKTTPQACKEAEITIQTFYRWRKEFGGLKRDQANRLKELVWRVGGPISVRGLLPVETFVSKLFSASGAASPKSCAEGTTCHVESQHACNGGSCRTSNCLAHDHAHGIGSLLDCDDHHSKIPSPPPMSEAPYSGYEQSGGQGEKRNPMAPLSGAS
jgi:Transposase